MISEEILKQYTGYGWYIFPCNGKIPATPNGFKNAEKDLTKVLKLFKDYPSENIGLVTGSLSGVDVLDVDIKNNAGGEVSFDLLREEVDIPETVTVQTVSGGLHLYFKHKEGVGTKVGFKKGLDWKSDGGYVICPESKGYVFEVNSDPETCQIAEIPDKLHKILLNGKDKQQHTVQKVIMEGEGRNSDLAKYAGHLHKNCPTMSRLSFIGALAGYSKEHHVPPLPEKEIETVATSILKYNNSNLTDLYDELYMARKIKEWYGDNLRYLKTSKKWYVFKEGIWIEDDTNLVPQLTIESIERLRQESVGNNKLQNFSAKFGTHNKRHGVINSLSELEGITITEQEFDKDLFLLNFPNITLNLETSERYEHSKNNYIRKSVSVPYDKDVQCPEWEKFLKSVFCNNTDMINYVQKSVGYSITGDVKTEQCVFILYGTGLNGKSTFLKHITNILGSYACNTNPETFMTKMSNNTPTELGRLQGKRFITCSETDETKKFSPATIKQLTSDERVTTRYLFGEPFDFMPTGKIWMATNHKPNISETDKGTWRRIKLIPFMKTISDEERDYQLDKKLSKEYQGIINWIIEGCMKWQKEGLGDCDAIREFTNEFREDSDLIGQYLQENCVINEKLCTRSNDLMNDYKMWMNNNGKHTVHRGKFFDYLKYKNFRREMSYQGKYRNSWVWWGIGLKSEETEMDLAGADNNDNRPF